MGIWIKTLSTCFYRPKRIDMLFIETQITGRGAREGVTELEEQL